MSVISITITESEEQIISGIPRFVYAETNIPASIFYTIDGSDPTISSSIYTNRIALPTEFPTVVLKIIASDGFITSSIISRTYYPDMSEMKYPFDRVTSPDTTNASNLFPYGDNSGQLPAVYGDVGHDIVDDVGVDNIPDGYDGTATGTYANGTDKAIEEYDLIFSTSNSIGERGHGIGTLPATVTIRQEDPVYPIEDSKVSDKFFNPKASVIYQDSRDQPYDENIVQLNRMYFSLENTERARSGGAFFTAAYDGLIPTGSFLRQHYNQRENTITYYYFDSQSLRWIISKEPCRPNTGPTGLFNIVFSSRQQGTGYVYKWLPFIGHKLT